MGNRIYHHLQGIIQLPKHLKVIYGIFIHAEFSTHHLIMFKIRYYEDSLKDSI